MVDNIQWDNYRLRIESEARDVLKNNKSSGVAIITTHLLVDSSGVPILWVVPGGKRIEPTKGAASILHGLLEGFDGRTDPSS